MGDDPVPLRNIFFRNVFLRIQSIRKKIANQDVILVVLLLIGIGVFFMLFVQIPVFGEENDIVIDNDYSSQQSLNIDWLKRDVARLNFEANVAVGVELLNNQGRNEELESDLMIMVSGFPIEKMVPFIVRQDKIVAAFLIGIAKKESNWGKRSPSLNGQDCYNYWGYRGVGSEGFSLGYGCFASPEEAIDVVGGRIYELAIENQRMTPSDMIVWKCGSSCEGHSTDSVNKWIQDVDVYYNRVLAYVK